MHICSCMWPGTSYKFYSKMTKNHFPIPQYSPAWNFVCQCTKYWELVPGMKYRVGLVEYLASTILRWQIWKYHQAKPDNGQRLFFGEVHVPLLWGIKYHQKWSMEIFISNVKSFSILRTVSIYIMKINSPTFFWLSHCKTIDSIAMIASHVEKSHFWGPRLIVMNHLL